jgi:hypothetical protein
MSLMRDGLDLLRRVSVRLYVRLCIRPYVLY